MVTETNISGTPKRIIVPDIKTPAGKQPQFNSSGALVGFRPLREGETQEKVVTGTGGSPVRSGSKASVGGVGIISQEPEQSKVISSRVIYSDNRPKTRVTTRTGGKIDVTDLRSGTRSSFLTSDRSNVDVRDVSIADLGIKSFSEIKEDNLKNLKKTFKETGRWEGSLKEFSEAFPETRLTSEVVRIQKDDKASDILPKLRKDTGTDRVILDITQKKINNIVKDELSPQYGDKFREGLNQGLVGVDLFGNPVSQRGGESKQDVIPFNPKIVKGKLPNSYVFIDKQLKAIKSHFDVIKNAKDKIKLYKDIETTRKLNELQSQYRIAKAKYDDAKKKGLKITAKKYANEIRTIYLKSGILQFKNNPTELFKRANQDMSNSKNWNRVIDILDTAGKKDAERLIENLSKNKNYSKFKKAVIVGKIGIKKVPINVLKLLSGTKDTSELRSKPFTLASNVSGLLFGRSLLRKGLTGKKVISAITQAAGYGLGGVWASSKALEFSRLKSSAERDKFITNTIAELLVYDRILRLPKNTKPTFNLKELSKLSPFYKDIKLKDTTPQTTPKGLLDTTSRKGETGNFYHVTSGKYKSFVRDNILNVLSKKLGMSKDRIKFNEDFLYVSDKGLVEYGIKNTKPVVSFQLGDEALKLFKGSFREFQSSNILKNINTSGNVKGKGKLRLNSEFDKILLKLAEDENLVIGGQRAAQLQVPKKYSRKTFDWDFTTQKNKEAALKALKNLNDAAGYKRFTIEEKLNGKLIQIKDTKSGDHIADFSKPFFKQDTTNIGGLKFVKIKQLINNKITALSDKKFSKRWAKDFKDLKSFLKSTGESQKYKRVLEKFENDILKGGFDPKQAVTIRRELKNLGFSNKSINFIVKSEKNPIKYGLIKLLSESILQKKPKDYSIFEFEKLDILKYPKSLVDRIIKANNNQLSIKERASLREDLVNYIKSNPNTVGAGSKTLSNMPIPFGLEQEWVIAPGSQFKTYKNIRSKFFNLFGIKKGEHITYDPLLDKVIQVYRFNDPKNMNDKQSLFFDLITNIKERYKNPKEVLQQLFSDNKIKNEKDLNIALNELTRRNPKSVLKRIYYSKYINEQRPKRKISSKESPSSRLKNIARDITRKGVVTPTRRFTAMVRRSSKRPTTRARTGEIVISTKRIERPIPRLTGSRTNQRAITPRTGVRPTPPINQNIRPPTKIPTINKIKPYLYIPNKDKTKDKSKGKIIPLDEFLQYTPTLRAKEFGIRAGTTTGQFTGLEVRGLPNRVVTLTSKGQIPESKKPLIIVAKNGVTIDNRKAKVREYKRRIPKTNKGKPLTNNIKILRKYRLLALKALRK